MNKKTFLLVFLISIFISLVLFLYSTREEKTPEITLDEQILSYEDCVQMTGSRIQESFPPVCVTKDGIKVVKSITQEQEEELLENIDTSDWEIFENQLVSLRFSHPQDWREPEISSTSSKDIVKFDNNFTITKGVYYTRGRDRVLSYSEFIEQNTPDRRIVTNYELANKQIKRASYDYSSEERAELFVFPPNENSEILSIFFRYPKQNLEEIREYFGMLSSLEVLPENPSPASPTETTGSNDCLITGCSGQICENEEVITTCEYKQEYACYDNATCERQVDGKCGWTMTEELQSCLEENRSQ